MANILVVDDELDVLEALARALRLAGHSVTRANQADEALRLCEDHSFDLVVLDYIMPSMSGIELLNKIRGYQPTIRSVIVSGKIDSQLSEEEVASELRDRIEADSYLHKPLDNAKLLDTIKILLGKDEERSWKQIAERNINAKKPGSEVKTAEKALNRFRQRRRS
jgi:two-component system phosphate regulon response regulator PhoB